MLQARYSDSSPLENLLALAVFPVLAWAAYLLADVNVALTPSNGWGEFSGFTSSGFWVAVLAVVVSTVAGVLGSLMNRKDTDGVMGHLRLIWGFAILLVGGYAVLTGLPGLLLFAMTLEVGQLVPAICAIGLIAPLLFLGDIL